MARSDIPLFEGLRSGDLTDLILPLISIDEFESKIDEDAIVVGFYVTDKDAADDLNRFVQRSPVTILDSDISPAPDQNGHFMVFIEVLNNRAAVDNILALVEEVSPLCNIDHWDAQIRGQDDTGELSKDRLSAALEANKKHDLEQKQRRGRSADHKSMKESVLMALRESDLIDPVVLDNGTSSLICVPSLAEHARFSVVAVGSSSAIMEVAKPLPGCDLSLDGLSTTNRVRRELGSNWDVQALGDLQLWSRNDDVCVLVRPV